VFSSRSRLCVLLEYLLNICGHRIFIIYYYIN
jgi:hypothetical protein